MDESTEPEDLQQTTDNTGSTGDEWELEEKKSRKMTANKETSMYDVIVIGGGAAGMMAAIAVA